MRSDPGRFRHLCRAFDLLKASKNVSLDLATNPAEDPKTYAMIQKADTVGVFQIESRARMAMLLRLAPSRFYDLVIEVAIVRQADPGQHGVSYLRRRAGKEPVVFPKLELKKVMGKTSAFRSSTTEDAGGGGAVAHHFVKRVLGQLRFWDSEQNRTARAYRHDRL